MDKGVRVMAAPEEMITAADAAGFNLEAYSLNGLYADFSWRLDHGKRLQVYMDSMTGFHPSVKDWTDRIFGPALKTMLQAKEREEKALLNASR